MESQVFLSVIIEVKNSKDVVQLTNTKVLDRGVSNTILQAQQLTSATKNKQHVTSFTWVATKDHEVLSGLL